MTPDGKSRIFFDVLSFFGQEDVVQQGEGKLFPARYAASPTDSETLPIPCKIGIPRLEDKFLRRCALIPV